MSEDVLETSLPAESAGLPAKKVSRRGFLKVLVTGGAAAGAAMAAKPGLETAGKVLEATGDLLTEVSLTGAQRQAREKLIEALETQKGLVKDLVAVKTDKPINLRAYPSARFEGEGGSTVLGNIGEGTKIPFAIEEDGDDPEHPGLKAIWYAFPKPGDSRPLERSEVVFSWSKNFETEKPNP